MAIWMAEKMAQAMAIWMAEKMERVKAFWMAGKMEHCLNLELSSNLALYLVPPTQKGYY